MLSATELLEVWERGLPLMPVQRASALLAACADTPEEQLGDLSIGRRDAHLLTLRESLFGPGMTAVVNCPRCNDDLELEFLTTEIRSTLPQEQPERLSLFVDEYQIEFRSPTSQDVIAAAAAEKDAVSVSQAILRRCVLSIKRDGEPVVPEDLPSKVAAAVAQRMEESDTLANVHVSIACPRCAHQWRSTFDIVSFLWNEIDAWAQRTLSDVHVLASAYGWNEREILALSPVRRQFYLQALGG